MKILMVDDSRTMRNIQKNVLKILGDPVCTEAGDGLEALTCVAGGAAFDLMLVDWNMPHMDGITFVRRVREKDKTTPIIMVTTEAEKTRIIDAIKAGVNNYVIKPFTPDALLERVKQTIAKTKVAA
jgi:two-component system, chemotaxis family, chemotaxis protein CheY